MANYFYLDASALVKRYVTEKGTPLLNELFDHAAPRTMMCLHLGTVEAFSILVRKKNAGILPDLAFKQILVEFKKEILDSTEFTKVPVCISIVAPSTEPLFFDISRYSEPVRPITMQRIMPSLRGIQTPEEAQIMGTVRWSRRC